MYYRYSLVPRPTLAVADGLHHHYASGKQPAKKKRTIRMQSTRDVTIRVQYVNELHGYLNGRDNGTVYFAYQIKGPIKVLSETNHRRE